MPRRVGRKGRQTLKKDIQSLCRLLTSPLRMMPDFLIPGEAKCGTTSLYRYITRHPQVWPADRKEPGNFIQYGASPLLCRMHYPLLMRKLFFSCAGLRRIITGEATQNYLANEEAARSVAAVYPNARLIVVMRNPVTRCFSDYQMMKAGGWEKQDFDEGIERHLQWIQDPKLEPLVRWARTTGEGFLRFILRGVYVDNITMWQKYFPKEQFLFIKSEELFSEPQRIVDETFRFLSVPAIKLHDFPVLKKGTYQAGMSLKTIRRLSEFYKPHNERLYQLIGRDLAWDKETGQLVAAAEKRQEAV